MSWSFHLIGKPQAVKAKLDAEAELTKKQVEHMPHEHAAVALCQEIIHGQLNFMIENKLEALARIEASGHAYAAERDGRNFGNTTVNLKFETISGFVE